MISSLVEMTLRGTAAFLLLSGFERLFAHRIHAVSRRILWLLVALTYLIPWKLPVLPTLPTAAPDSQEMTQLFLLGGNSLPFGSMATGSPGEWLSGLWALGMAVCLAIVLANSWRTNRRWSRVRFCTDSRLLALLEDTKTKAGVTAPIGLIVSPEIPTPVILGWLRPRILLPASLGDASDKTLSHIFLHELAHFRAMDIPAGWLFTAVRCAHWFNPFAWIAAKRWTEFREGAADENAVRWSKDPQGYGETLLAIAGGSPLPFGALAIAENFLQLKYRITMITNASRTSPRFLLTALAAVILATVGFAQTSTPADPKAAAVGAMEPWLKEIDGGKYADSWTDASRFFQKAITSDKWVAALTSVRTPLGRCHSRKLASAILQKDPVEGGTAVKGEFVVAQFDTSFANMKYAVETVSFVKEGDSWKAAGYFIKPRQ